MMFALLLGLLIAWTAKGILQVSGIICIYIILRAYGIVGPYRR